MSVEQAAQGVVEARDTACGDGARCFLDSFAELTPRSSSTPFCRDEPAHVRIAGPRKSRVYSGFPHEPPRRSGRRVVFVERGDEFAQARAGRPGRRKAHLSSVALDGTRKLDAGVLKACRKRACVSETQGAYASSTRRPSGSRTYAERPHGRSRGPSTERPAAVTVAVRSSRLSTVKATWSSAGGSPGAGSTATWILSTSSPSWKTAFVPTVRRARRRGRARRRR